MKMKNAIRILSLLLIIPFLISCGGGAGDTGGGYGYYPDYYDSYDHETYRDIQQGQTIPTAEDNLATFSLKVDTSAYTNVHRFLENSEIPPQNAVKTEELINYFNYDNKMNFDDDCPFAVSAEIGPSPMDDNKIMAVIRVKTPSIDKKDMPASNLVFLIDTSGSMSSYDKLPLVQKSLEKLVEVLEERDTISIVTYAGSSAILLEGAHGNEKDRIMKAINSLSAGGSTAGQAGIQGAYRIASEYYINGGNNRVILASDGDFNVGINNTEDLKQFISNKRDSGIYLTVLGFGAGNLRDDMMETLAANGNGNYHYIDCVETANKVLVEEMGSNLFVVADDVKAQVAFNVDCVKSFRLIGYENRMLDHEDFENDNVDAGEIGAGTDVLALFELELTGDKGDLFEVRIRYKDHGESESKLKTLQVPDRFPKQNSSDFQFACSVAFFGEILRNYSDYTVYDLAQVYNLAAQNLNGDISEYRSGFLDMVNRAAYVLYHEDLDSYLD